MTGTVTFGSRDITNMRGHRLARMGLGFVPQTKDVFDTLTVTENLEMGGYLLTKPQLTARIEAVMSAFPALRPVDLPAPFGPLTETTSPGPTLMLTPDTIAAAP